MICDVGVVYTLLQRYCGVRQWRTLPFPGDNTKPVIRSQSDDPSMPKLAPRHFFELHEYINMWAYKKGNNRRKDKDHWHVKKMV